MASTLLNEQRFPPDVIELQLAHGAQQGAGGLQQGATPSRAPKDDAGLGQLPGRPGEGAAVVPIRRFGVKRDLHRVSRPYGAGPFVMCIA